MGDFKFESEQFKVVSELHQQGLTVVSVSAMSPKTYLVKNNKPLPIVLDSSLVAVVPIENGSGRWLKHSNRLVKMMTGSTETKTMQDRAKVEWTCADKISGPTDKLFCFESGAIYKVQLTGSESPPEFYFRKPLSVPSPITTNLLYLK